MTISVVALNRGGFSASGGAWFDARDGLVRMGVCDPDDLVDVVVQFSSTPTEVTYEENGLNSSTPAISGNTVTLQFQSINPNGEYKLVTYFSTGASRTVWFRAHPDQPSSDGEVTADVDYGDWG